MNEIDFLWTSTGVQLIFFNGGKDPQWHRFRLRAIREQEIPQMFQSPKATQRYQAMLRHQRVKCLPGRGMPGT